VSKINKALDYNKLLAEQAKGKLLKKHLSFSLFMSKKYDGNYVNTRVENGKPTFITTTSERHTYTHSDSAGDIFCNIPDGVYMSERVWGKGKLGDRVRCNLTGSANSRKSVGHKYRVHDVVSLSDYDRGRSSEPYKVRRQKVMDRFDPAHIAEEIELKFMENIHLVLKDWTNEGYEGAMLKSPDWYWEDTKSRKITMCKYKKRRTADLVCVNTTEGEGKYEGLIGALILEDSEGRKVSVGSGLSDVDRTTNPIWYLGKVIEIEFEQVIDTYIQPTFITVV